MGPSGPLFRVIEYNNMFPDLSVFDRFAYDTETTGLRYRLDRAFGISISTPDNRDYYWDVREHPAVIPWFNDQMVNYRGVIIMHNAPFDCMMSDEVGIKMPLGRVRDTVMLACLINEHEFSFSLDALGKKYLGAQKVDEVYEQLADMFGGLATRNVQMKNLSKAPSSIVAPYAKMDTRLTLDLYDWQQVQIDKQDLQEIVKFEEDRLPHFIRNMMRGVRVDVGKSRIASAKLTNEVDTKIAELHRIAGFACNHNPSGDMQKLFQPKQNRDGIWIANDGTMLPSTPKGKPSINADALRAMKHPAAGLILRIRKLTKLRDTFIEGHILGNEIKGRVYPHINQTKGEDGGTGTGRLSYSGPALQQISKRDKELCAIVRDLFLPDEGHLWSSRDWAQSDFRFMVHYTKQPKLMAAYAEDPSTDFHSVCSELTGIQRNASHAGGGNAKQINLGLVFGMGEGKLATEMGLPAFPASFEKNGRTFNYLKAGPEAQAVFEKYHTAIPGIKSFLKQAEKVARSRGYVKSMFGRHIRFPRGEKSHKAGGLLFQAATAELLKDRYKRVCEYLDSEGGSVIMTVHDEFNNNVPEDKQYIDEEICRIMQDQGKYRVPLKTTAGLGKSWWDAMCNEVDE